MTAASPLRAQLEEGAASLGLALSAQQVDRLLAYQALMLKWNKVYNLTAVRDAPAMLTHHLLDSLAVISPLQSQLQTLRSADTGAPERVRLLDVGSGAGLPGVVMASCVRRFRWIVWTP